MWGGSRTWVAPFLETRAVRSFAVFLEHRARLQFELRVTKLGHVQRGGAPTAFDRVLASRLGAGAIDRFLAGESGILIGMQRGEITATPLAEVVG